MQWMQAVERSCREALRQPDLQALERALAGMGTGRLGCLAWARAVDESPQSQAPITRLRERLVASGRLPAESYALERWLLLQAALDALPRVPALPTGPDVHRLLGEAFGFLAAPDDRSLARFRCGGPDFASMCKVATLRRFPAGQFEWELSGIPRSWALTLGPRTLLRLARVVATDVGGLKPLVFPHFAACGPRRIALREGEVKLSFYRMAAAMERQPEVRGLLAIAWFLSPDALRINPKLGWLLPIFEENGALVGRAGPAELGIRQLGTNPELRQAYDRGAFRPRLGFVVWPRRAMLDWASRRPPAESGTADTPRAVEHSALDHHAVDPLHLSTPQGETA